MRAGVMLVVSGVVTWWAFGCGGGVDVRTPGSGAASTAGASARAGTGVGGASSGNGMGVSGGANLGARAGSAGSGMAGSMPSGGYAGSAGGGAGALGGNGAIGGRSDLCPNAVPEHKLSPACPVVRTAAGSDDDTLLSVCNAADEAIMGKRLHFGLPWSVFDENGCFRHACYASSECGSDERCVAPALLGDTGCLASTYGNLVMTDCECDIGESGDCSSNGFCLPAADYPTSNDCVTAGKTCVELASWTETLGFYDAPSTRDDLAAAVSACEKKLARALAACSGEGGQSGAPGPAGAGGQSGL